MEHDWTYLHGWSRPGQSQWSMTAFTRLAQLRDKQLRMQRVQELPGPMDFGMFPGGMSSWLPPSTLDISQDSIRRPPAA